MSSLIRCVRLAVAFVVVVVVVATGRASAQPSTFTALVDGGTARYQAYLEFPETGDARTTSVSMRLAAEPARDARTRSFAITWLDESGAPVPGDPPFSSLPRRLVVSSRGLTFDAVRSVLPTSFESLPPRPPRVRPERYVTYSKESLGCFEYEHPGADPAEFRSVRACFASDGVLREFVFDSGSSSIELAGPVTRPSDVVGSWEAADASVDRRFAASLRLDDAGLVTGTYVTESAWSTECAVSQIDDPARPELVAIHLRCVDHIIGDESEIEEGNCALVLVGGELVLERCPVESHPLARSASP